MRMNLSVLILFANVAFNVPRHNFILSFVLEVTKRHSHFAAHASCAQ